MSFLVFSQLLFVLLFSTFTFLPFNFKISFCRRVLYSRLAAAFFLFFFSVSWTTEHFSREINTARTLCQCSFIFHCSVTHYHILSLRCCGLCSPMLSAYSTGKTRGWAQANNHLLSETISNMQPCSAEKCSQMPRLCNFFAFLFLFSKESTSTHTPTTMLTLSHFLHLYSLLVFCLWGIGPV